MKRLDLSNVTPSTGDGFAVVPEGAYVMVVTGVKDVESKMYLEVTFDIAEGDYAGYYNDEWGASHPWAHAVRVSYKDAALGMLKHRLNVLTASNPGFDAEAMLTAANETPQLLGMFVGRAFGLSMLHEHVDYQGRPLEHSRPDWGGAKWCTAQEARESAVEPPRRDERHTPVARPAQAAQAGEAIPF